MLRNRCAACPGITVRLRPDFAVYALQKPFLYLGRKNFPESPILENFIQQNMTAMTTSHEELFTKGWFSKIDLLLSTITGSRIIENGANQIAKIIENYF